MHKLQLLKVRFNGCLHYVFTAYPTTLEIQQHTIHYLNIVSTTA